MNKLWIRRQRVSVRVRMRLYNALVLTNLVFGAATWGMTDSQISRVSRTHRKQLRLVLGIRWPNTISDDELYERCNTFSIEKFVKTCRLKLAGHILRLPDSSPAVMSMCYYIAHTAPRFVGRPCTCLPTVLKDDLRPLGIMLKSLADLEAVRSFAADRRWWSENVVQA